MFDELRQGSESEFQDDEEEFTAKETPRARSKLILGMTAPQRFMISVMLLVLVGVISCFLLLATDKLVF